MTEDSFHIRGLLESLGLPGNQGDHDEAVRWALVELHLRRKEVGRLQSELDAHLAGHEGTVQTLQASIDEQRQLMDRNGELVDEVERLQEILKDRNKERTGLQKKMQAILDDPQAVWANQRRQIRTELEALRYKLGLKDMELFKAQGEVERLTADLKQGTQNALDEIDREVAKAEARSREEIERLQAGGSNLATCDEQIRGLEEENRALKERTSGATHRCKVCGALWSLNPPTEIQPYGSWSVVTPKPWRSFPGHVGGEPWPCGPCCDNAPMGDQIEALSLPGNANEMHAVIFGYQAELAQLEVEISRLRKEAAEMWWNGHDDAGFKCAGWAPTSDLRCHRCGQRNPYATEGE